MSGNEDGFAALADELCDRGDGINFFSDRFAVPDQIN